ncbi:MAG: LuxR family transcriptional regulator [Bdellovibrionota bacterium]|nr:MAG: LuxR family transcriptional regulator [Bdellovibrionota bacterium]
MSIERLSGAALLVVGVLLAVDVRDDLLHGSDFLHVAAEVMAFTICAVVLGWQVVGVVRRWRSDAVAMEGRVKHLEIERDAWRTKSKELLAGLGSAVDAQFRQWGLSAAEKEVGLLILKGLSHKEIATLRQSSERTVRQQAASIYAKSGLEGKAGLAAFFLEDLFLPNG